jgi:two-component system nitrate/nitrite response regulator NarL
MRTKPTDRGDGGVGWAQPRAPSMGAHPGLGRPDRPLPWPPAADVFEPVGVAGQQAAPERRCAVAVVHGNRLFREAMRRLLEGGGFAVAAEGLSVDALPAVGGSGGAAARVALVEWPRVRDGADDPIAALRGRLPGARVVALLAAPCAAAARGALAAGADGCVTCSAGAEDLFDALAAVAGGRRALSAELSVALVEDGSAAPAPAAPPLTEQESAILVLLGRGQPNKAIARTLGLPEGTVKLRVRTLLRKLGKRNRTEAALWALAQGAASVSRPAAREGARYRNTGGASSSGISGSGTSILTVEGSTPEPLSSQ